MVLGGKNRGLRIVVEARDLSHPMHRAFARSRAVDIFRGSTPSRGSHVVKRASAILPRHSGKPSDFATMTDERTRGIEHVVRGQ
jgi:hypothetical protein